jgi:hypothetical protein
MAGEQFVKWERHLSRTAGLAGLTPKRLACGTPLRRAFLDYLEHSLGILSRDESLPPRHAFQDLSQLGLFAFSLIESFPHDCIPEPPVYFQAGTNTRKSNTMPLDLEPTDDRFVVDMHIAGLVACSAISGRDFG